MTPLCRHCSSTTRGEGARDSSRAGLSDVPGRLSKLRHSETRLHDSRQFYRRFFALCRWVEIHERLPSTGVIQKDWRTKRIWITHEAIVRCRVDEPSLSVGCHP